MHHLKPHYSLYMEYDNIKLRNATYCRELLCYKLPTLKSRCVSFLCGPIAILFAVTIVVCGGSRR